MHLSGQRLLSVYTQMISIQEIVLFPCLFFWESNQSLSSHRNTWFHPTVCLSPSLCVCVSLSAFFPQKVKLRNSYYCQEGKEEKILYGQQDHPSPNITGYLGCNLTFRDWFRVGEGKVILSEELVWKSVNAIWILPAVRISSVSDTK